MRKIALLFSLALPLAAAPPAGFIHLKGTDLKTLDKKLAPKVSAAKVAMEQFGKVGNHNFQAAYREGSGEAEVHETQTDIFVVQSGKATLLVGGTIPGGKTSAPNEIRGAAVEGGEKVTLEPGDIVNIPPKTPHQIVLDPGAKFTYIVIKVDAQ